MVCVSARADWMASAFQLTGQSSAVYERAVRDLRAQPGLAARMRLELEKGVTAVHGLPRTEFFLALDVIATLRMKELVPDLEELVSRDASGYAIHALNRFMGPEHRGRILALYRARLDDKRASTAVKLALLDTLSRYSQTLTSVQLARLAADGHPSVREAAIAYARRVPPADLAWVREVCAQSDEALRAQLLYWLSELKPPRRELCAEGL